MPRIVVNGIVLVVAGTYLVAFVIEGAPVNGLARPLGAAASAAALFVLAFDKYLWRAPGVRFFVRQPYVGGTWRGSLASHWIDPETGERIAPDPEVYLVIRQRYWGTAVRLITKESKSASIIASVDGDADGAYGLFAIYRNTPRAGVRHRSPIHHGALMLDISGQPPVLLEGFYWTDRTTMGELNLQVRFRRLVNDYAAGQVLQPNTPRRWRRRRA
jgi:hypothetical protein